MERTVLVAMSGGVDSSVAALLLKEQGFDVVGVFMRLHPAPADSAPAGGAPGHGAGPRAEDARRAAEQIGVPFQVLDLAEEFSHVVEYFVEEYGRGRTPNPCVVCNRDLKFGRLVDHADSIGADFVATGHYARLEALDGHPALLRGADRSKDQSYALFAVPYRRLGRLMFPLGRRTKAEARRLACERGLAARDREESQEICFVAGDYVDVVRQRRADLLQPGPIIDETGREVGRHQGIAAFTVGQRKGIRIAFGQPRYVTRIDPATATVHVGPSEGLHAAGMLVEDVTWLLPAAPGGPLEADVQIRYRHKAAPAHVAPTGDGLQVRFVAPQRAVTPGQAAVFYRGDRVLGGGWIARPLTEAELAR